MKRDMELIRKILLFAEGSPSHIERPFMVPRIEGYEQLVVYEHVALLKDAGYLLAVFSKATDVIPQNRWLIVRLTWAGHEFLAAARNDTIWQKVMDKLKAEGISAPVEVLKDLLGMLVRAQVGA
jgi:hypothetical protein